MSGNGVFVVKYRLNGSIEWANILEVSNGNSTKITVDKSSSIYLLGTFTNNLSFGSQTLAFDTTKVMEHFLAKANSQGSWVWYKNLNLDAGHNFVSDIQTTPNNNLMLGGSFNNVLTLDQQTVSSGTTTTFIADMGINGIARWIRTFKGSDINGCEKLATANNVILFSGRYYDSLYSHNDTVVSKWGKINYCPTGIVDKYLAKIVTDASEANGVIFRDENANGIQDINETGFEGAIVAATPGNFSAISRRSGSYALYLNNGTYTLGVSEPPRHYTVSPASHTVTFSAPNQASVQNFALVPVPNRPDLSVSLTEVTAPRPNFPFVVRLTYQNVGTTVLSDTVTLSYDSDLIYDSASFTPASVTNNSLSWTFSNLQPMQKQEISLYFFVPASLSIGDTLINTASISLAQDVYPSDNVYVQTLVVVNSSDPNDKQVKQQLLKPAQVAAGEYLVYTIRFQNTGTAPAFDVSVVDTLSKKLNLTSLQVLNASHSYKLHLREGGVDRKITPLNSSNSI